jgi:hypothetical protein
MAPPISAKLYSKLVLNRSKSEDLRNRAPPEPLAVFVIKRELLILFKFRHF